MNSQKSGRSNNSSEPEKKDVKGKIFMFSQKIEQQSASVAKSQFGRFGKSLNPTFTIPVKTRNFRFGPSMAGVMGHQASSAPRSLAANGPRRHLESTKYLDPITQSKQSDFTNSEMTNMSSGVRSFTDESKGIDQFFLEVATSAKATNEIINMEINDLQLGDAELDEVDDSISMSQLLSMNLAKLADLENEKISAEKAGKKKEPKPQVNKRKPPKILSYDLQDMILTQGSRIPDPNAKKIRVTLMAKSTAVNAAVGARLINAAKDEKETRTIEGSAEKRKAAKQPILTLTRRPRVEDSWDPFGGLHKLLIDFTSDFPLARILTEVSITEMIQMVIEVF